MITRKGIEMRSFINGKKIAASALAAAMSMAFIPQITGGVAVFADEAKNQDNTCLATTKLASPEPLTGSFWQGSWAYFGKDNNYPIEFRVLAPSTTKFGGKTVFIDSVRGLFTDSFDNRSEGSTAWNGSSLQAKLNGSFMTETFTDIEREAIPVSYLEGGEDYPEGSFNAYYYGKTVGINDRIFLLDAGDVSNPEYGFPEDPGWTTETDWSGTLERHFVSRIKGGVSWEYWLRTPHDGVNEAGLVGEYGELASSGRTISYGVAPALNIDLSRILFSTAVSGEMGAIGTRYAFTLFDGDMEIVPGSVTTDGSGISVSYEVTGDNAGNATTASVLILDKEYDADGPEGTEILYYSALSGSFGLNSEGTFTLPSTLDLSGWGTDYYVYLIAEDRNEDMETDYASSPVLLDAPGSNTVNCSNYWGTFSYLAMTDVMVNGIALSLDKNGTPVALTPGETATLTLKNAEGWMNTTFGLFYDSELKGSYVLTDDGNGVMSGTFIVPEKDFAIGINQAEVVKDGWIFEGGEYYYYIQGVMQTKWLKDGGKWYYLDPESGIMAKGWQQVGGKWYFFKQNGSMVTGWNEIGGRWYWFNNSGAMVTGWQKIGDKWYYFAASGAMKTGWLQEGGSWYYLEKNGAMVTGWKIVDGDYYFFKSGGVMASNEYCDGYRLDPNGKWTYKVRYSWKKDSRGWYYEDSYGWYLKDVKFRIDGKIYEFDKRGYCTNP